VFVMVENSTLCLHEKGRKKDSESSREGHTFDKSSFNDTTSSTSGASKEGHTLDKSGFNDTTSAYATTRGYTTTRD
jgi:hypothetical protein